MRGSHLLDPVAASVHMLVFCVWLTLLVMILKMLIKAMKMVADEEWIMVEPVD